MISIRKYLDTSTEDSLATPAAATVSDTKGAVPIAAATAGSGFPSVSQASAQPVPLIEAYRAALNSMGRASVDACPALGPALDRTLAAVSDSLSAGPSSERIAAADSTVRTEVHNWGLNTARHYRQKAADAKAILLAMARAGESVGERDQRCAQRFHEVTAVLRSIATLDDISEIRASIEKSATDLKGSIDRMTAEGQAAMATLRAQVTTFQAKLADAEYVASSDALTRLRSRLAMESQIEQSIAAADPFCVALLDLDGFKAVNDEHGHLAGDDVLRQFASELKAACRSSDLVGRWGGDEFLILLASPLPAAQAQMERVRKWVCGSYTVNRHARPLILGIRASIGVAEFTPGDTLNQLLERADVAMYGNKLALRRSDPRKIS